MKVFASTRRKAITCAGTASPSDDLIPTYPVRSIENAIRL